MITMKNNIVYNKLEELKAKLMANCGEGKCYDAGNYACQVDAIMKIIEDDENKIHRLVLHCKDSTEASNLTTLLSNLTAPRTMEVYSGSTYSSDGEIEIMTRNTEPVYNNVKPTDRQYRIEMKCGLLFSDDRQGREEMKKHQQQHKGCKYRRIQLWRVPLVDDGKFYET